VLKCVANPDGCIIYFDNFLTSQDLLFRIENYQKQEEKLELEIVHSSF